MSHPLPVWPRCPTCRKSMDLRTVKGRVMASCCGKATEVVLAYVPAADVRPILMPHLLKGARP
jgi:hypothetical protein